MSTRLRQDLQGFQNLGGLNPQIAGDKITMIRKPPEYARNLRLRAEEKFQIDGATPSHPLSPEETEHLLHELKVHQIELEMQNEELRLSQAELDAERARYFDLYELAPSGYLTISEKGLIQQANLAAATMLGVVRNFLLQNVMSQFIFFEDQDVYYRHLKLVTKTGKSQGIEIRLLHANGAPFWTHLQITQSDDEYRITLVDISARKQAELALQEMNANLEQRVDEREEELRESEELFAQFMLHSPVHTYVQEVTPTECRTLKCSDSFQQMLGMSGQAMLGKTMQELFPQALADKITADSWAVVSGGNLLETEEEFNGRYYTTIKFPIVQQDRKLLAGYTVDITERKMAENALREMSDKLKTQADELRQLNESLEQKVEERTRALQDTVNALSNSNEQVNKIALQQMKLFDASPVGIAIVTDRIYMSVNNKACEILGYGKEELLGSKTRLIYPSQEAFEQFAAAVNPSLSAGKIASAETLFLRKDGTEIIVRATGNIIDKTDHSAGTVWFFEDITSSSKAEAVTEARLRLLECVYTKTLEGLLRATLDEAEALTGSQIGFYHFVEPDQTTLSLQVWSSNTSLHMCKTENLERHYPVDQAGVWVDCIRERKGVIHNDYSSIPHRRGLPEGHAEVVRELVVPVLRGDAIVAILGVGNKSTDYNEQDIETITALADLAWDITDSKRTQDALNHSENLKKKLFENHSAVMLIIDPETLRILDANEAAASFYGWTIETLKRMSIQQINILPAETVKSKLQAITLQQTGQFEFQHRLADGSIRVVAVFCNLIEVSATSKLLYSIIHDITDHKHAERQLQSSEAKYRAMIDAIDGNVYICSKDYRIEFMNGNLIRQLGRNAIGEYCYKALYDFDAACEWCLSDQVFEGKSVSWERKNPKDGSWHEAHNSPIHYADGTNARQTILTNITDRKHAETKILKLQRAIEQSPVTIMITDTQGTIEFVNPKFTELTGYSAEESIGMNIRVLKSGKTPVATYLKLWATITAGETWEGEFVNKRKDGTIFYEYATISSLRDDQGAITHYLAVKEDITEKKSVMEQLIHAQKMESIGQLAGGLAHDLNNILSVINGYATLSQLELDRDHEQYSYITAILEASTKAATLTHSLLAYSRKQEMNLQNQDINPLIETIGSFIKRIIPENIEFSFTSANDPLIVYVDKVQIEQVLLNLATNARDAMPNCGKFSIATSAVTIDEKYIATHGYGEIGSYAVITVTDTGHGMDEKTKLKVFDPFFTTKAVDKGTGLGLSMVTGIINQHGGFIDLQSEIGKGTVFSLHLPLLNAEVASKPAITELQIEKASGTILLVEDDQLSLAMMEEILTRGGYTVITAVDGQDAVEKFAARKDDIQLVISDIIMPRKSGKEARDEIRQMSAAMQFILVSGHTGDVIGREGKLGADFEVVMKPIMPFELLKKIRELMN